MAAPGILEARYRRLAGDEDRRLELYLARRRLGFTIDEWRALPWWHRRVYLEGINTEAEAQTQHAAPKSPDALAEAILTGTMDDVQAAQG